MERVYFLQIRFITAIRVRSSQLLVYLPKLNSECIFSIVFLLREVDDKSIWLPLLSLRMRVTLRMQAGLQGTLPQLVPE
jgi:hypothetical protein